MTLADLPVLNPSTPGREARRAALVATLFLAFGVLYALARAAATAPPDISASTDLVLGFAFPKGWGIAPALWTGSGTWPGRLAAADMAGTLAVLANVLLAIALVVVMHPDILSRQGPQYVSPARRITTVVIALVLAFLTYAGVGRVDDLFSSGLAIDPDKARRQLIGYGALSALLFGGVWSFIGPKDFGRRIPLRISHGALGGLAIWAAITFATLLSNQPRTFLSSSLDTFYTLLTLDAANGNPGATAGWAVSTDVLTAGVAMAVAGALLVVTAPQSLGPGNRRGGAAVAGVLAAFLAVVALTTYATTRQRARAVATNVVESLQLERTGPMRTAVLLIGQDTPAPRRLVRTPTYPTATADDCAHAAEDQGLPAATAGNLTKLSAYLDAQGRTVSGVTTRAANCRIALLALLWRPEAARRAVFVDERPERSGALTYLYAMTGLGSAAPAELSAILRALADTTRYQHGSESPRRFADFARLAGDTALEAEWRPRLQEAGPQIAVGLLARPAYTSGSVTGRIQSSRGGWRVGLFAADDPAAGGDPMTRAPRSEGAVLTAMVSATDVGPDGRFAFTGLRDGYYFLALLAPEGTGPGDLSGLRVQGDPGVFALEPLRRVRDLGVIRVDF